MNLRNLIIGAPLLIAAPVLAKEIPLNPAVTQETIQQTICVPGWTKTVRPSFSYTNRIKHKKLREAGVPASSIHDYELDHIIPLSLGGSPNDERNLQLQPWDEAHLKDAVESCLPKAVCDGSMTLAEARKRIWSSWREGCPWNSNLHAHHAYKD